MHKLISENGEHVMHIVGYLLSLLGVSRIDKSGIKFQIDFFSASTQLVSICACVLEVKKEVLVIKFSHFFSKSENLMQAIFKQKRWLSIDPSDNFVYEPLMYHPPT